jgi:hypothetical protein
MGSAMSMKNVCEVFFECAIGEYKLRNFRVAEMVRE